jgi:DNA-binding IclR family transcriptional regulator
MSQGVDRRERLLTRLRERHPEPCSAADFATALLPGESKTGALHMSLEWLVGHGLATRSGEPGAYRWSLVPAEEVTP